jgi:hypothetical protein
MSVLKKQRDEKVDERLGKYEGISNLALDELAMMKD